VLHRIFKGNDKDIIQRLRSLLEECTKDNTLDTSLIHMINNVIKLEELQLRDIMIPRAQMVTIPLDMDINTLFDFVIEKKISRFPVIDVKNNKVVGILLAKDLLFYQKNDKKNLNIIDICHKPHFFPESKKVDKLLNECRKNRIHMVVVIDEYADLVGLITIEDLIEQIIGDIEDEYIVDYESDFIQKLTGKRYLVKAQTPIDVFNRQFNKMLKNDWFDTISGFITHKLGYIPRIGEKIELFSLEFTVIQSDARRVYLFEVKKIE
jgi:magnesium and cobalt transporter